MNCNICGSDMGAGKTDPLGCATLVFYHTKHASAYDICEECSKAFQCWKDLRKPEKK